MSNIFTYRSIQEGKIGIGKFPINTIHILFYFFFFAKSNILEYDCL